MSWFADLAGKAESLLNNLDEQTGAALRNHNVVKKKADGSGATINPDAPWERRRRPIPRNLTKKITPISDNKSVSSTGRKASPHRQPQLKESSQVRPVKESQDSSRNGSIKSKKSPSRKASNNYNLNHPPKTLVGDIQDDIIQDQNAIENFGLKQRRHSLPADLELLNNDEWAYKVQNMEVENAMLKNELTVMNREVAELLDRLRSTEDEAAKTRVKLETLELLNQKSSVEKETLTTQIDQYKQKIADITNNELRVFKEQATTLQAEVDILRNRNLDLELRCKEHLEKSEEKNIAQIKLENDLRHAQATINDLHSNLQKSIEECRRLERDWEAYKLRVKNMLIAKDNEIKALQEDMNTEDSKVLLEQIGNLKDERDELSDAIAAAKNECNEIKSYVEQVEARHAAAERVVTALRDALRDERAARNKADAQYLTVSKEIKHYQVEAGQTIASLRTALREKETELHQVRESSSTSRASNCDSSALNVADYDNNMHETIENNKIQYLTQTLVQRQTKLDSLLAENNKLRIQLEKSESKYKTEITNLRSNYSHSVVHLQDGEPRSRSRVYAPTSSLSALSLRIGVMMKRYPIIRIFFITYMVCLHFWVLTVLFTSTPDDFATRPAKS